MRHEKVWFFASLLVIVLVPAAIPIKTQASSVDAMHRNPLVVQAIEDLACREAVSPDDIEVVSSEAVTWPDTSMGCPRPDMRYRQVPQDGMRIILRVGGRQYAYHSGGNRPPFLCKRKDAQRAIKPMGHSPDTDGMDK